MKIGLVEILSKPLSKGDSQKLGEIIHTWVDSRWWDRERHKVDNSKHELLKVSSNNLFNDLTIYFSEPNTHVSSQNQKHGQNDNISCFFARVGWDDHFQEILNLAPECGVDISSLKFLCCISCSRNSEISFTLCPIRRGWAPKKKHDSCHSHKLLVLRVSGIYH